jgi:hypothetical protein
MSFTPSLQDFVGELTSHKLPDDLANLSAADQVFFERPSPSQMPFRIHLSHPNAPHSPAFSISWISEETNYLVLSQWILDPDTCENPPPPQVLVRLVDFEAIELLSSDEFTKADQVIRSEILRRLSQADGNILEEQKRVLEKKLTPVRQA